MIINKTREKMELSENGSLFMTYVTAAIWTILMVAMISISAHINLEKL